MQLKILLFVVVILKPAKKCPILTVKLQRIIGYIDLFYNKMLLNKHYMWLCVAVVHTKTGPQSFILQRQ